MHRARTTERKRCASHYAGIGVSTAGTHPVRETPSSSSASRASRAESHIPVRDLNDLLCEYLSGRIRPVAQLQRSQAILVGRDERSDVLGCKGCILQKPVDGHGGAPSEKSRRRARAILIAAMRPATPNYLHRTDEHHLNSGGNSTRQKTHFGIRPRLLGRGAVRSRRRSRPVRKLLNGVQAPVGPRYGAQLPPCTV